MTAAVRDVLEAMTRAVATLEAHVGLTIGRHAADCGAFTEGDMQCSCGAVERAAERGASARGHDLADRLEAMNLAGAAISVAQGVIRVARVLACSEAAS